MQLLIIHRDPEMGEAPVQMVKSYTRHHYQLLGTYHVRAHVYFADLNKFFYSQTKVFEAPAAQPTRQKTVGVPERNGAGRNVRTIRS